jgi:tetratricopeptide (TPR) repeat protein
LEERASIIKLLGLPETFAVLLLTFSFILLLAPYFSGADFGLFKIPQFTDSARKKLKLIGPIAFLALVMLFVPLIPRRVPELNEPNPDIATDPNTITILVATFSGPDEHNYLVTEKIIQGLRAATSEYSDISVQPLGEAITEQTGSKGGSAYARDIGTKRKAGIVLWGYYGATSEQVDVNVYFEVLRPSKGLSLRQNFETKTLPIADLKGFKIQTPLSKEMSYLVLLTVGIARYESGDYEGAISRFTKALTQSNAPDQIIDPADIYFYRGSAHYFKAGANGIDHAIADMGEVIKLKPDYAEAYSNRGTAYYQKGQYDLAIADYSKAIELKPDDADAYFNRGSAYDEKNQHDPAIADFDKAIKIRADYVEAYSNRGIVYGKKGQYDLAIADYSKAIELKPDDADGYYNRGTAYYIKGQYDLAIADYSKAIELKPDYAEAYYNRALVYQEKGERDRAIADLKSVLRKTTDTNLRQRAERKLQELG